MKRPKFLRGLLIVFAVFGSWLWMQPVHELGHVVVALATGGHIARVDLPVFGFSYTQVSPNPQPLWVVWGGPVLGSVIPLALWALAMALKLRSTYLFRFFAGFCLVANGVYLLIGALEGGGDPGDLLRLGAPAWTLTLFAIAAIPSGLFLWHGEGQHFGLGKGAAEPSAHHAFGLSIAVTAWIVSSLVLRR